MRTPHQQQQPGSAARPSAGMQFSSVDAWRKSLSESEFAQMAMSDVSGDEVDSDENAAHSNTQFYSHRDSVSSSSSIFSGSSFESMQPSMPPVFNVPDQSFRSYPLHPPPEPSLFSQFSQQTPAQIGPLSQFSVNTQMAPPPQYPRLPPLPHSAPPHINTSAQRHSDYDVTEFEQQPLDAAPSVLMRMPQGPRRSAPALQRLHTENLRESMASALKPTTPLQATNLSLFSPDQTSMITGGVDLSSWLAEPVLPSPLYTHGPSTGWNSMSPMVDPGKTPTAYSARDANTFSTERLDSAGAAIAAEANSICDAYIQTPLSSPASISAIDWWMRDEEAQERFHRYMINNAPSLRIRPSDPKATLAMSTSTRFLAYSALLALTGPTAAQPPFFHRHLLMLLREKLPTPLSICRSVMSAISLRQRSNDHWAWSLVGNELEQLVNTARSFLSTLNDAHQRAELSGLGNNSPELTVWFQSATRIEGGMELLAMVQSIWFLLVVGSFGSVFEDSDAGETSAPLSATKYWCDTLVQDAIQVLQALVHLLTLTALQLQRGGWRNIATPNEVGTSAEAKDAIDSRRFQWWGFCETVRRTVLASHALLALLRHIVHNGAAPSPLGIAPFPELCAQVQPHPRWESSDWSALLELELPAVATVFEAENYALYTANSRHAPATLSLASFINARPPPGPGGVPPRELKVYFKAHDEFTNVCLSVLFGLTADS